MLLTIAYDGQQFSGFARQHNGRTIAGELDGAIRCIDPRATLVRGASRTDAGVHARGQVAAFDTDLEIDGRGWALAITRELPKQISIVRVARTQPGFVPRFRARQKTYRYLLLCSPVRDPFLEGRAWRLTRTRERFNHELMADAAQQLVGEHDFRAFRASGDERTDTVRRLVRACVRIVSGDPRCIEIIVTGDRFMYRMMRIIVGTLVDIALGKREPSAIAKALTSGRREDLGITAPPDGLYLERVELDDPGLDPWPSAAPEIDEGPIVA